MGDRLISLPSGAEMRVTGAIGERAVVCVNGGQAAAVPGTWSATLEWLVARLAPRLPGIVFAEVRYRVKSWKRLDWCEEDRLDLARLRGRRLDVLHGQLDRWLPGIPGVSPESSRRGFERARSLGVEGTYRIIPGAVHGIALRAGSGVVPLPRARRWAALAAERIETWEAAA